MAWGRKRRYTGRNKGKTSKSSKWHQGAYEVKNREKYMGAKNPIYRSSWELDFMKYLDSSDKVLCWQSEEPKIKYLHPLTKTIWNYHPDFLVKLTNGVDVWWELIEIKPYKQTTPPKGMGRGRSKVLAESEQKTWLVNQAKWDAAKDYCKQRKWKFRIITEKDLS
jgi:hypothetical protein